MCVRPLIFYLSDPRAPLDLLSFPTRRSSDLSCTSRWAIWPAVSSTRCQDRSISSSLGASGAATAAPTPALLASRDRKSTRLNSSHVAISYAVFCLKKKIAGGHSLCHLSHHHQ